MSEKDISQLKKELDQGKGTAVEDIVDDAEAFDQWFEKALDPDNCDDLGDIIPSQPGWQIRLHFDKSDPRVEEEGQAYEDYKTLTSLEEKGVVTLEFEGIPPFLVLVVNHNDQASEREFSPGQVELFYRYNPIAKAKKQARHSAHETQRPPAEIDPGERPTPITYIPPAPRTMEGVLQETREDIVKVDPEKILKEKKLRQNPMFHDSYNRKIYEFQFISLIFTFPYSQAGHEQIRARLRAICDEENLKLTIEPDDATQYFDIIIDTQENSLPGQKMKEENITFLAELKEKVEFVLI